MDQLTALARAHLMPILEQHTPLFTCGASKLSSYLVSKGVPSSAEGVVLSCLTLTFLTALFIIAVCRSSKDTSGKNVKKAFDDIGGRGPLGNLFKGSFGDVCAIVLIAAVWNACILINFAGAGDVAQAAREGLQAKWGVVWQFMLSKCGGDEQKATFWSIVGLTQVFHMTSFWIHSGVLAMFDVFPKSFPYVHKWKIQNPGQQVDTKKMMWTMLTCLFNQVCINGPLAYVLWPLYQCSNMKVDPLSIPSWGIFVRDLCVFGIVEEIGFYYGHRLMHVPFFYKRFHKQHHEWTSPVGCTAIYADPLEHITSNLLPVMMGPWICGSHMLTYWFWLFVAVHVTIQVHSGYHFPFLPSSEFHDFHHLKFNVNFGVIGFLDWFHGTDEMMYRDEWKTLQQRDHTFLSLSDIDKMPAQQAKTSGKAKESKKIS